MKKGFYAGSFDPFTNGHLQVVTKSAKIFDEVVVGIAQNDKKTCRFSKEEMKNAMEQVMKREGLKNVKVIIVDELVVDVAKKYECNALIRGIRNGIDYEEEENLASINEEISGLDTIYIRAGKFGNISSSMVMELLKYGKDISPYVPEEILKLINK